MTTARMYMPCLLWTYRLKYKLPESSPAFFALYLRSFANFVKVCKSSGVRLGGVQYLSAAAKSLEWRKF